MSEPTDTGVYNRATKLFQEVVDLPPEEQRRRLDAGAADDPEVRALVDQLLAGDQRGCILENEESPRPDQTESFAGQVVGRYRILEKIGEGGMSVVYRAEDTTLGRTVALKFLSSWIARHPESLERFVREAKAAASIDHPNVCPVYEIVIDGPQPFLAMAYLEGPTLADWLSGPMEIKTALEIAVQVCRGLEAAHRKGVVHRDIKPANLLISQTSTRPLVRILDFGIARLSESSVLTRSGLTVGTVAYMAPEQIETSEVDGRADLWALGVVLYRMVAGALPFEGATTRETLAAIAQAQPKPLAALRTGVPEALAAIVGKALEKDPQRRYANATQLLQDLEDLHQGLQTGEFAARFGRERTFSHKQRWLLGAVSVAGVLLSAYILNSRGNHSPSPAIVPERFTSYPGSETAAAISPDGTRVAFAWDGVTDPASADIYIKLIDSESRLRITNSPGRKHSIAWSPDGTKLAFIRGGISPRKIFVVSSLGGPETEIAALAGVGDWALDWSPKGDTLAISGREGIFIVSPTDSTIRRLTVPGSGEEDRTPRFGPDGSFVTFSRLQSNRSFAFLRVPTSGGTPERLGPEPDGIPAPHRGVALNGEGTDLVYPAPSAGPGGPLYQLAMSSKKEQPASVAELSAAGPHIRGSMLVYSRHELVTNIWALQLGPDGLAAGKREPLIASSVRDDTPAFSPDGSYIAFSSDRSGAREIWKCRRNGASPQQLTSLRGIRSNTPAWSPDGRWIAFDDDFEQIYVISSNGGKPRRLTSNGLRGWFPSWSRDGRWVYFTTRQGARDNIWKIPSAGGEPVQVTKGGGFEGVESHDGRHLYYCEARSSRHIRRLDLETGKDEPLPEFSLATGARRYWALARKGIYFLGGKNKNELNFYSFESRETATLESSAGSPVTTGSRGMALSPDDQTLLFVQKDKEDADIMLVRHLR